jgi:hypothetical protein
LVRERSPQQAEVKVCTRPRANKRCGQGLLVSGWSWDAGSASSSRVGQACVCPRRAWKVGGPARPPTGQRGSRAPGQQGSGTPGKAACSGATRPEVGAGGQVDGTHGTGLAAATRGGQRGKIRAAASDRRKRSIPLCTGRGARQIKESSKGEHGRQGDRERARARRRVGVAQQAPAACEDSVWSPWQMCGDRGLARISSSLGCWVGCWVEGRWFVCAVWRAGGKHRTGGRAAGGRAG